MDMWSLGVILYIMLTGSHPFDLRGVATDEEIEAKIKSDPSPPFSQNLTGHLSPAAADLIKKLMTPDPAKRLTASEMLSHPWLQGATAKYKIADSNIRLEKFKEIREKVEAGIFAVLVKQSTNDSNNSRMIEKAFEMFDKEHKGSVSADDFARVLAENTDIKLTSAESKQISDMVSSSKSKKRRDKKVRDERANERNKRPKRKFEDSSKGPICGVLTREVFGACLASLAFARRVVASLLAPFAPCASFAPLRKAHGRFAAHAFGFLQPSDF